MKAEYKRDLQNNYLILQAPDTEAADGYPLHMAEQNEVSGLLPFYSSKRDGLLYLHYEITSKQPLAGLYEKRFMNSRDIIFLLSAIRDTAEQLHKYLLNPSQLVFDPEYIYMNAKKSKILFCYLPGAERECRITELSEFILKRLEHEDRKAVALGYSFYQKASEANFSLQQTLKEILLETEEQEKEDPVRKAEERKETEEWIRDHGSQEKEEHIGRHEKEMEKQEPGLPGAEKETYEVVHKKRRSVFEKKVDRLFRIVHPAVFLSGLFLLAALEITYYFGMIGLTEAGGIFFLTVSVGMMGNKHLLERKNKVREKEKRWADEEEESEAYRLLKEEMYASEPETDIEETQYLGRTFGDGGIRLVCVQSGQAELFPDICLEDSPVYVGKIPGEADVILNAPTVSRIQARLETAGGKYYIRDMNSRNGTFCNGRRLDPQEQCEFRAGDRIRFAEIEYQAVSI